MMQKEGMAAGHTQTHTHTQKSRVGNCPAVVLLCCAVLCERSTGPLCSGVHGKQGPVGRCLARRRHVAMQPSLVVKLSDSDLSSSLDLDHD